MLGGYIDFKLSRSYLKVVELVKKTIGNPPGPVPASTVLGPEPVLMCIELDINYETVR